MTAIELIIKLCDYPPDKEVRVIVTDDIGFMHSAPVDPEVDENDYDHCIYLTGDQDCA